MWGQNVHGSCVRLLDKVLDVSLKDVSMVGLGILCWLSGSKIDWIEWRSINNRSRRKEKKMISLKVVILVKRFSS